MRDRNIHMQQVQIGYAGKDMHVNKSSLQDASAENENSAMLR